MRDEDREDFGSGHWLSKEESSSTIASCECGNPNLHKTFKCPASNTKPLGAYSKATTTNPKDLLGVQKASITKLPAVGIAWGAMAMMDGAAKYGPYNWREKDVVASIYIDAAIRHLHQWFEGQEVASDSKVHHLGHAIACCAILLDAQFTGNLKDDRPIDEKTDKDRYAKFLDMLSDIIKEKNAAIKG